MEVTTAWSLEPCKYCRGSRIVGRVGKYNIFCENCEGKGMVMMERCALATENDDEDTSGPQ